MTKEAAIGTAIMFFIVGILIGSFELYFRIPLNETVYACMGIALFFYVLSLNLKPEKTEWTCQKCAEKLVRKQIKFGLCPHCGVRVEGFRGLHPNRY